MLETNPRWRFMILSNAFEFLQQCCGTLYKSMITTFWIEFDQNMFEAMKQLIDKLKNQILFHDYLLLSHFL